MGRGGQLWRRVDPTGSPAGTLAQVRGTGAERAELWLTPREAGGLGHPGPEEPCFCVVCVAREEDEGAVLCASGGSDL